MEETPSTYWPRLWRKRLADSGCAQLMEQAEQIVKDKGVRNVRLELNQVAADVTLPDGQTTHVSVTFPNQRYDNYKRTWNIIKNDYEAHADIANGHFPLALYEHLYRYYYADYATFDWMRISMVRDNYFIHRPDLPIVALLCYLGQSLKEESTTLFELSGRDIREQLRLEGRGRQLAKHYNVLDYNSQFYFLQQPEPERQTARIHLDLSRLKDRTQTYLSLLEDDPDFYPEGNFRTVYQRRFASAQRRLRHLLDGKTQPKTIWSSSYFKHPINLGPYTRLTLWALDSRYEHLALYLQLIHPGQIDQYSQDVFFHYQAYRLAQAAILTGHVIFTFEYQHCHYYRGRWQVDDFDPAIRELLSQLAAMIPPNKFYAERRQGVFWKGDNPVAYPAFWLVTSYVDALMRLCSTCSPRDDEVTRYLFRGDLLYCRFDTLDRAVDINSWIYHARSFEGPLRPLIRITEVLPPEEQEAAEGQEPTEEQPQEGEGPCFCVECLVRDTTDANVPIVNYTDYPRQTYYARHWIVGLRECYISIGDALPELIFNDQNVYYGPQTLQGERFLSFLLEAIPVMRRLGIQVEMPPELAGLIRPRRTIRIKRRQGEGQLSMSDLLDFDWQVALGDKVVGYNEFQQLVNNQTQALLKVDGQYVLVSPADLQRMADLFSGQEPQAPIDGNLLMQAALVDEYDSAPIALTPEVRQLIKEMTEQVEIPLPEGLQATLRPYQERGYSWLYRNLRIGFGSILADDMGLGKTLQTIALLLKLKEEGQLSEKKALIVVPASLMHNWQAEIARFAPSLTCQLYHGNDRSLNRFTADLLITTYGLARTDLERLNRRPWRVVVIDEAQNIKNHSSLQSRALRQLKADCRIALSGTPVENRLSEYWSIMDFVNRGYLGSLNSFNERYAAPIQAQGEMAEAVAERFRRITAPFMMRRMKSDKSIIADLPDKIEQNERASLLPDQAALYQTALNKAMAEIEQTDPLSGGIQRKGLILQMILHLKQICDHPALFLKDDNLDPSRSGKTELLLTLVDSVLDAGDKVLIFTQFKTMAEYLQRILASHTGRQPLLLHGSLSLDERTEVVRRFQEEPDERILVLSLKAAGTGLNLTAASHVIHYDLWWNPAVESQATDRAYRIGQRRNVVVHRMITHSTFEERIDKIIQDKKALANLTVATGESWITNLTNEDLRELFAM